MIMVHLPPGIDNFSDNPISFEIVKILTSDILGRGSVSALSFVSGFLIFHSLQKKSCYSLIINRFGTLIVPMVFWNTMIISLGFILLLFADQETYILRDLEGLELHTIFLDRILAVNYGAASDSLNFLRDIFVCVVLSQPLVWLIKHFSWLVIISLLVIDALFSFQPIIMRGMILLFFSIGILFACKFGSLDIISRLRIPALFGFVIVLSVEFGSSTYGVFTNHFTFYELFKRLCISILAIDFSFFLAKTVKSRLIDKIDRATYFVFLAHNVFFLLVWGGWQKFFGTTMNFPYIIFYIVVPVIWVILATLMMPILAYLPLSIQKLIYGKQALSISTK